VRGRLVRQFTGLMAQAFAARIRVPNLRLIVPMPGGLASQARTFAIRDRGRGGIDRRRVFPRALTMVRMAVVGVLDGRVRGRLVRQFTGLMAQAVVARVRIPNLRLIVHMPAGLASGARGVALRDGRRGGVDRRRVFPRALTMIRMAVVGVLDGRVRGRLVRQFTGLMAQAFAARIRVPNLRLIVPMPGGLASQARSLAIRDRGRGGIERRRVFPRALTMVRMAVVGVLDGRVRSFRCSETAPRKLEESSCPSGGPALLIVAECSGTAL
jgi:hypothetical protein